MEPYLEVVHKDDDLLVLNKPSGLLSVPGKAPEHADCLESRAQEAFPQARIVHRLDMATSGLLIMAMNPAAHRHLGLQFERRKTEKTYIARVWGRLEPETGEVDLPLICDWPNRPKQMVCHERGKKALTTWRVLAHEELECGPATRVELTPFTGRSHQLRVHMLSLGHVILGDHFYATGAPLDAAPRLQLHAERLSVFHPADGTRMNFHVPCPF